MMTKVMMVCSASVLLLTTEVCAQDVVNEVRLDPIAVARPGAERQTARTVLLVSGSALLGASYLVGASFGAITINGSTPFGPLQGGLTFLPVVGPFASAALVMNRGEGAGSAVGGIYLVSGVGQLAGMSLLLGGLLLRTQTTTTASRAAMEPQRWNVLPSLNGNLLLSRRF